MKKKQSLSFILKQARMKSGLSQKEISDLLGYRTPQFVSNWERGLATPPGRTLHRLAKLYKTSPDQLFRVFLEETLDRVEQELKQEFYG